MSQIPDNLFKSLPETLQYEAVTHILNRPGVRIERIVSRGHTAPESGWFDQTEHEWVMVMQGEGHLEFEEGRVLIMRAGDHLIIPAHTKHKVVWTKPGEPTLWLAVFYRD